MIGITSCIYETPCGWCAKWDKKCDRKISTSDLTTTTKYCAIDGHEWEFIGISTIGTTYVCKKRGVRCI